MTYAVATGEIYDADMGINTAEVTFSTSDTEVEVGLLSVITHEAGHFLGLDHSADPDATMFAAYRSQSLEERLEKRTLTADDEAGICALYPPGPIAENCDATPRHGVSPVCADDQPGPVETEPAKYKNEAARCCCLDGYLCGPLGICMEYPEAACCSLAPGRGASGSRSGALVLAVLGTLALAARRQRKTRVPGGEGHMPLS